MTEYLYKGLRIVYKLEPHKTKHNLFSSVGYVADPCKNDTILAKFHTDYNALKEATLEIKKLMEDYIDFEWRQSKEQIHDVH